MISYVLVRDDGKYVSRQGSLHSYTDKLQYARLYSSYEVARNDACGNETPRSLEQAVRETS